MSALMSFNVTKAESDTIRKIVDRARSLKLFPGRAKMDITMDITATHANGCPLKLDELLKADDFNFVHDLIGIWQHLNRENGKLEDCFLPRFAK
jgi:hypothetical protein